MRYPHAPARNIPAASPRAATALMTLVASLMLGASGCQDPAPVDSNDHTDVSGFTCEAGLIEAAHDIASRFPDWGAAHHTVIDATDDVWYHPAHSRKELEGFGVTLVSMHFTEIAGVKIPGMEDAHWHGDLNDPTLLFFEKIDALDADDWPLIGFGYHVDWSDDEGMGGCVRPEADCTTADEFVKSFIVHEAGYHIDGFMCVDDDDIQSGHGTPDADYCDRIDTDDVKDPNIICIGCEAEGVGAKHGRAWTMHVWIHPGWRYPLIAEEDPWGRDNGNGWEFSVESRAFGAQGDCDCEDDSLPPPSPVMGTDAGVRIVRAGFLDQLAAQAQAPASPMYGLRVTPVVNAGEVVGHRIVEMSWFYGLDDLGLLTGDLVQEIDGVRVRTWGDFVFAAQRLAALPPGAPFVVRIRRDQEPRTLLYRVGQG